MKQHIRKAWLSAAALLLALPLIGCGFAQPPAEKSGAMLWQTAPGVVLQSTQGPLSQEILKGKALLVFFGYTRCPDVCPTGLSVLAQVLTRLTPEEHARVRVVFVTVDPLRDQLEQIRQYLPLFHPQMLGLYVPSDALPPLARAFRVYYRVQPDPDGTGRYAIDHSAHTGLVDPQGRLVQLLPYGASVDEVLKRLRNVL